MSVIPRYSATDFPPLALAERKGDTTVSVCLPARDEEATVGRIVELIRRDLIEAVPLVDELIVMDDHSEDHTAKVAAEAGAEVVHCEQLLSDLAPGPGKGAALWRSLFASHGDIVVWCDTDVTNFGAEFVAGLVGPLLAGSADLVKGYYHRPIGEDNRGGGRVTELVARPLISLLFPELSDIVQPLAGEYAGRREVLERVPFVAGYGVETGLLIDVGRLVGPGRLAQVDLAVRLARNRPLEQLAVMAVEVMQVALRRADPSLVESSVSFRPLAQDAVEVELAEVPPMIELAAYRDRK